MKNRDLLGITVDSLMHNYVSVWTKKDHKAQQYIGIIEWHDMEKLSDDYVFIDIVNLVCWPEIMRGEVLDIEDVKEMMGDLDAD